MSVQRSVIQFDDEGNAIRRYKSIQEAQAEYQCSHISSVCRGTRKHEKGYVWRYEYNVEGGSPFRKRRRRKSPRPYNSSR